ncbi:MAG TPA: T9SS type A sorting domain-containing protein [bacterium]|nr:T9SS type A sorting domain-containing protein [bacterium]
MNNNIKLKTFIICFVIVTLLDFSGASDSYCDNETNRSVKVNPVHMVVVFSKFKGEAPDESQAPDWAQYIFDGNPGSVPHYWDEISFGQIVVTGEYLPKLYELPNNSSYYADNLEEYTLDLLNIIDNDSSVDFSLFDNDGSDGIPGSIDDDKYVDFLVLMPLSRPHDFISGDATGQARLNLSEIYNTSDKNSQGVYTKIDDYSGCIATGQNRYQAIGLLCHEYCHYFGTPDLYDVDWDDGETDSAGIGYWGLMSHGLLGWNGYVNPSGPVAPSAYTRMLLSCIGINNANLVDLYGIHRDVRISDVGYESGKVYRIWVGEREYFLIEHRRNDGIYYDRDIPKNGILIWHITEINSNSNELLKICDLECADGRYSDAGYPMGEIADTISGGDNLDFWAHDSGYASNHVGNLGDSTDVYDGVTFTRFGTDTNPDSRSKKYNSSTGLEIFNIHPEGVEMVFDVNAPPFTGWISGYFPYIGTSYQRFMDSRGTIIPTQKISAMYLVNYGRSINADALVTVYQDSMTVDNLSLCTQFEVQKAIERRIFEGFSPDSSFQITRENIQPDIFENAVRDFNYQHQETPLWVQKISFEYEERSFPSVIELSQNYPNPFNSQTFIKYNLPTGSSVTLEVFNILGQKVMEFDRGLESAGIHTVNLDMEQFPSGVYLYRIKGNSSSQTRKFLLIR